jgi:hypothetical protein
MEIITRGLGTIGRVLWYSVLFEVHLLIYSTFSGGLPSHNYEAPQNKPEPLMGRSGVSNHASATGPDLADASGRLAAKPAAKGAKVLGMSKNQQHATHVGYSRAAID